MKQFNQNGNIEEMLRQVAEGETLLLNIVSVKDLARNKFQGTRCVNTTREAIRDFKYLVENDPMIKNDPQDFELYHIGMFNPATARMDSIEAVRLSRGSDFIASNSSS